MPKLTSPVSTHSDFSPIAPRFFNHLNYAEHTAIKSSTDIAKIKSEYIFYQLLPKDFKPWMVTPYNYTEKNGLASYTMDKIPHPTLASLLITSQLTPENLPIILDQLFLFLSSRPTLPISEETYLKNESRLYQDKLHRRIADLKSLAVYPALVSDLQQSTKYHSLDEIVSLYQEIYDARPRPTTYYAALSHGDLCFSNIFYNANSHQLLFIDPRGALTEPDLYLDPYYDIAKLAHSIHGGYDYFNAGLYQTDPAHLITAPSSAWAVHLLQDYLTKNHYNYTLTRIYEASLFLSMLPLHIDSPRKVLAFIYNAIRILEEVQHEL